MSNRDGHLFDRNEDSMEPRPYDELPEEYKKILDKRGARAGRNGESVMEKIEGKHMLRMLLYIDERSPVLKSELYSDISRGTNMPQKIDDLRSLGLIEVYRTIHNTTNILVITPKGKIVAMMVRDMIDTIDRN